MNKNFYLMYFLLVDQFKKTIIIFVMGFLESSNPLTMPLPRSTYHYSPHDVENIFHFQNGPPELLLSTPLPPLLSP
jgi:hypothetical protein